MSTSRAKAVRQEHIVRLLRQHAVHSQGELATLLSAEGVEATQATLSRDLEEIGAVRLRTEDSRLVYTVPGAGADRPPGAEAEVLDVRLVRIAQELLVSVFAATNLVIVRTPPGGAQYLASAIDHADWASVLGTVAGDDTVLVVSADPHGAPELAARLIGLTDHTGAVTAGPAPRSPAGPNRPAGPSR